MSKKIFTNIGYEKISVHLHFFDSLYLKFHLWLFQPISSCKVTKLCWKAIVCKLWWNILVEVSKLLFFLFQSFQIIFSNPVVSFSLWSKVSVMLQMTDSLNFRFGQRVEQKKYFSPFSTHRIQMMNHDFVSCTKKELKTTKDQIFTASKLFQQWTLKTLKTGLQTSVAA